MLDDSPTDFASRNNIALALIEQRDPDKLQRALAYAEANYRDNNKSADALSTLGWVYFRRGEFDQARLALRESVKATGGNLNPDTATYLAYVLYHQDQKRETKNLLEKLLKDGRPFCMRPEAKAVYEKVKDAEKPGTAPDAKRPDSTGPAVPAAAQTVTFLAVTPGLLITPATAQTEPGTVTSSGTLVLAATSSAEASFDMATGSGTVAIPAAGQTYTGTTTISAGTLSLATSASSQTGTVTFSNTPAGPATYNATPGPFAFPVVSGGGRWDKYPEMREAFDLLSKDHKMPEAMKKLEEAARKYPELPSAHVLMYQWLIVSNPPAARAAFEGRPREQP